MTDSGKRSTVQLVALVFGLGFLVAAIAGFVQGGMSMEAEPTSAPQALGLFPVNLVHNVVHLLFAVWGLVAAKSFAASRAYCRIAGVIYLALVPLGFLFPTGFGLIPLGGNDVWLHLALGLPLAIVGFTAKEPAMTAPAAG